MRIVETTNTPGYSPGLDGVLAGETALCHVDEGDGGLRYRGFAVSELADKATFEEVAANDLGEPLIASPALAHGQIFLRTEKYLYCIEDRK